MQLISFCYDARIVFEACGKPGSALRLSPLPIVALVNGVPVALPPPIDYVVNFDHPQRNSVPAAYWLFGVGNSLCIVFMGQRVYVKAFIQKRIQIEDEDFAAGIMGTRGWEMPLTKFMQFVKTLYILPILYNLVQAGAKMALLLLYRRIALQRWFKYTFNSTLFITIFPCKPISGAWDITIQSKCINRPNIYKATAIVGAVTDSMVLAVPLPVVINLRIPRRQKINLVFMFSVGVVTVFTSIMRLITLINSMSDADQTWGGGPVLLWIFAEANMSVICGTLSTLKLFISAISPKILGSSYAKQTYGPSNPSQLITPNIGSRSCPDKYSRFDDEHSYALDTMVDVEHGHTYYHGDIFVDGCLLYRCCSFQLVEARA
ncbi:hypothetical protein B0O99DRAFT_665033 [Bisporella sp. PMI_857]|nr:hypothetical protein B0O99DRAFT_665033 [Bisporella sp. PMI_857]